jgi:hypothetical protein
MSMYHKIQSHIQIHFSHPDVELDIDYNQDSSCSNSWLISSYLRIMIPLFVKHCLPYIWPAFFSLLRSLLG